MASIAAMKKLNAENTPVAREAMLRVPENFYGFAHTFPMIEPHNDNALKSPKPQKPSSDKERWQEIADFMSMTVDALKGFGMTLLMTELMVIAYKTSTGPLGLEAAKKFNREEELKERRRAQGLKPTDEEDENATPFFFFAPVVTPEKAGIAIVFATLSLAALRGWRELTVLASMTPPMMQKAGRRGWNMLKAMAAHADAAGFMPRHPVAMPAPLLNV